MCLYGNEQPETQSSYNNYEICSFQVKVELFRNGELAVEIYFDGRGSTSSDWFTKNRLRSNSFIDLNQTSVFHIFSMDG